MDASRTDDALPDALCVFCGSNPGRRPVYTEVARELGGAIARRGRGVVYGGGNVGLMGIVADAALAAGGSVVGVIPEGLAVRELAHEGLTRLEVVESMHERKQRMAELSAGFIALPGGLGTFEEILEITTWAQLGIHGKPCGLLDVDGYWCPLLELLDNGVEEGFVKESTRALVLVDDSVDGLLAQFDAHRPAAVRPWLTTEEA